MRFSKGLLKDQIIMKGLFDRSIEKTKKFLLEIFELYVNLPDRRIENITKDDELYSYKVKFNFKERNLMAELTFEPDEKGYVQEVLNIHEFKDNELFFLVPKNYEEATNAVLKHLEKKYSLNFTPLDPEDKDENIKQFIENDEKQSVEAIFTNEDYEEEIKVSFIYDENNPSSVTIKEYRQYKIYLD